MSDIENHEDHESAIEDYEKEASETNEHEEETSIESEYQSLDYVNGPLEMVLKGLMKSLDQQLVKIAQQAAKKIPRDSVLGKMLETKREIEQKIHDLQYGEFLNVENQEEE